MELWGLEPLAHWSLKPLTRPWSLEMELLSLEFLAHRKGERAWDLEMVKRRAWDLEMKLRSLEPLWPTAKLKRRAWDLEMELWNLELLAYLVELWSLEPLAHCKGETEGLGPGNGAPEPGASLPSAKLKRGALDLEMELRCLGLLTYCKGETEGLTRACHIENSGYLRSLESDQGETKACNLGLLAYSTGETEGDMKGLDPGASGTLCI
ncbi:hypothetical protein AK812_SmicGene45266 [Symbiodinium microadriaticum]|uniref:Uncharacterized protein n=1 Tax=Symbiodinium microadriaticum TaxID=2951 RepID=A0A1Q9BWG7_SYMMI|nr:hypothetical protein AK812_SmicGene45266 [Symbiodinium microadriaticum]